MDLTLSRTQAESAPDLDSTLDQLLRLGNFFELDFQINTSQITAQLEKFAKDWVQYNPYKPQIPRQGLSVTSLDGSLGGRPDLYSLAEYYRREGKLYREVDFRTLTTAYHHCSAIHPLVEHFYPHLGRSHFLRFNAGGYFPPHRDGAMAAQADTFRILVPLININHTSLAFLFNGQRLHLSMGQVYFINTLIAHSIFSFCDGAVFLVLNVILNRESLERVKAKLGERRE